MRRGTDARPRPAIIDRRHACERRAIGCKRSIGRSRVRRLPGPNRRPATRRDHLPEARGGRSAQRGGYPVGVPATVWSGWHRIRLDGKARRDPVFLAFFVFGHVAVAHAGQGLREQA